jgi:hypothetical protein
MSTFLKRETKRADFSGTWLVSSADGTPREAFPSRPKLWRTMFSKVVIFQLCLCVIIVVNSLFLLRSVLTAYEEVKPYVGIIIGAINAVQIQLVDYAYDQVGLVALCFFHSLLACHCYRHSLSLFPPSFLSFPGVAAADAVRKPSHAV